MSMQVFIVGPESAGKTVFAAVLADFVQKNSKLGLTFEPRALDTKRYCNDVISRLEQGQWPDSTTKMCNLDWRWRSKGQSLEVCLVDPPGQRIREELSNPEITTFEICKKIDQANLLMLVVDVAGHQESADTEVRLLNEWIVQHVLQRVCETDARVIIVVTKGDLLTHLLSEDQWSNSDAVLELLRSAMPGANWEVSLNAIDHSRIDAVVVSSVSATKLELCSAGGEGSEPHRFMPKTPLQSEGLPALVAVILNIMKTVQEEADREGEKMRRRAAGAKFLGFLKWSLPVLVIASLAVWWGLRPTPKRPPPEIVWIDCSSCFAGKVPNIFFPDIWPFNEATCTRCNGSGGWRSIRTP